jgi:hypothetical protein
MLMVRLIKIRKVKHTSVSLIRRVIPSSEPIVQEVQNKNRLQKSKPEGKHGVVK